MAYLKERVGVAEIATGDRARPPSSDEELGRQAAQDLWQFGLDATTINDPLTPKFARGALAELEELQHGTPGVLKEVLEGAQMSAEQLNVESFHGLIEVVQNADDLHASDVRVAVRESGKQHRLLIAHSGGERVELPHVIAMTLAFVSTKRNDPRAKGRFGIGLKTLGRLGDVLTVHCAPYDFDIVGNRVRAAGHVRPIPGFYNPLSTDTLLDLRLREGFDAKEFQTWFASLGSESLLFLDTVRSLRLLRIGHRRALVHHQLTEVATDTFPLFSINQPCKRTTLRSPRNGSWERYEIQRKMPPHLRRRYKAREAVTPIAIALPTEQAQGQIYAGLPLGTSTLLPFSLNAQFDIDVARRGIQHEPLNTWLFERLAELTAGVALDRLSKSPAAAWRAIPLKVEKDFPDDAWVADRIADLVDAVHKRVRRQFRIGTDGEERRLGNFAYEAEALDGLLTQKEIRGLKPGLTLLPDSARDADGRWRAILSEFGVATLVDVGEALKLLDWSDQDLEPRDVRWFVRLARAAIEADLGNTLWLLRSIIATDGLRLIPPMAHVEGELLLRVAETDSLAFRLGLAHVIDPIYLSEWHDAVIVRKWLEENDMLRSVTDPESTLRALASRDWQDRPPRIGDDDLRLIRDAFVALDAQTRQELGPKIGEVIVVDVQTWEGSKRVTSGAPPAQAYLPASIEDRKDGWSKAAGRARGLCWIHPRYQDVLSRPGRQPAGSSAPRPLAARAFFGLLGAEVAPRLVAPSYVETRHSDPASPINRELLYGPQVEALHALTRHATHFKGDHLSPDLGAALKDLQRERGSRSRRERERALLTTLEREWERLYAHHTSAIAVWSYSNWHPAGEVPASWLANAMAERWLSSEDDKRKAPRELAVRTRATEAILGNDPSYFASELVESDAGMAVVRALGIQTDPQVSEMIDQLAMLRDQEGLVDEQSIMLRYAAIAANCKKKEPGPDDMVGDLPMRKLRARFGIQPNKPGLVYANNSWLTPSKVFLGAPIFGSRRPFVSERSAAEQLWRALRMTPPSLTDCIDVLTEMAGGIPSNHDDEILVNTYRYLDLHLAEASGRDITRLETLPLWNGTSWQTRRPIYVVAHDGIAQALSSYISIWKLPVAPVTVSRLITAVSATLLVEDDFAAVAHEQAFVIGATFERRFAAAVELLRDWLSRHDPKLFTAASVSWEELARAQIAIDSQLQIELRLNRRAAASVPTRAHLMRSPLILYFADLDALREDDAGGRVIASLFTGGDRDKLALAWSRCWERATNGERGTVTLIEDSGHQHALTSLFEQAKGLTPIPKRAAAKQTRQIATTSATQQSLPVRRLKRIEDLSEKTLDVSDEDSGVGPNQSRRRGLRDGIRTGREIGDVGRAPQAAPLAYSEREKEDLALQILQFAINGGASELRDYRHLRGVGADALDRLRRYFELKAYYGALPDDITLTGNEAERAFRESDNFCLAVVAGLEEGYDTVVKIFPNPLRSLEFKPTTSVTLTGIRMRSHVLTVRLHAPEDENNSK